MTTLTIQLPFSGFYHSIHDAHIDSVIECYTQDNDSEALSDAFYNMTYDGIWEAVSKHYTQAYDQVFYDKYDIWLDVEFSHITSPRFYNFETDKLYVSIKEDVLKQVIALLDDAEIQKVLNEKYRTQDGFICFDSTKQAIKDKDYSLFTADLLNMLLPEDEVIDNYQYMDNISEVISNAFPDSIWDIINSDME